MDDSEPVNGTSVEGSRGLNIRGPILIGKYGKAVLTSLSQHLIFAFLRDINFSRPLLLPLLWVAVSNSDLVQHDAFSFKCYPENKLLIKAGLFLVETAPIKRVLNSRLRVSLRSFAERFLLFYKFLFCCFLFLTFF